MSGQGAKSAAGRPRIYLAGPDVFLANSAEIGEAKRLICAAHGLEGLYPGDTEIVARTDLTPAEKAEAIFRENVALMRLADGMIANLSPFRGPNADDGTAFEVGFAAALGMPVVAYSNAAGDLAIRTNALRAPDDAYAIVEDFGHVANLMLACAVDIPVIVGDAATSADALTVFGRAVAAIAARFEAVAARARTALTVRAAGGEDAEAMARLLNEIIAVGGTTAIEKPMDADAVRRRFIAPPRGLSCMVAEAEGRILGFQMMKSMEPPQVDALLVAPPAPDARWGLIASFVDRSAHGRGVGRALFAATQARARGAGLDFIDATIRRYNEGGLAFYDRLGFETYGDDGRSIFKRYALA